ncbi:MAG: NTP transferase domain-containing protein [Blautia sp.]|nr:NTP transferase domain-containing protein [Blautia sp.]
MKKTTLVIMAAGIGSRFGKGNKQLAPVGPHGEVIMDYSARDAAEAGFDKVVFIIRRDFEEEFRSTVGKRIGTILETDYAFQSLEDLPQGFKKPADRTKPWGTGHAILCAKQVLKEPFAVINADDYYGKAAYRKVHDFLVTTEESSSPLKLCMAGFRLGNTLSENGGVTRGICQVEDGKLTGVKETKNIYKTASGAEIRAEDQTVTPVDTDALVSMNMWGLPVAFLDTLESGFKDFLSSIPEGDIKKEYLLPIMIDELIRKKQAEVKVLHSPDQWFGVTYQEDKEAVAQAFLRMTREGKYPDGLYQAL